ncbi:phytoene/squalene synthase family protein [Arsenicitalea aurantiaca]|uniref:Phytoene/squalene synthase family protein n=1 Tax=Arsenicitalea aurantiaca TaxID=1783274 RepID=A0A433XF97_9HYPH|nr:phytoene/squalene synthase family protein [Arsenicitalea aurantiaca]RUT32763.1 phytoene/squalene synthase family protein [Arsenicitalea aurantiaca]
MSSADGVVALSEQSIAKGSKSFAAAARLFDRQTRDDAVMLYAWCRHCDDVIDGQTSGHDQIADFRTGQAERLALLRAQTDAALIDGKAHDPIFEALRRVAERHQMPAVYPRQLLDGFEMDVTERRYETLEDTLDYGYHVAGVVGVMMAMIMGARAPGVLDRASDLGIAFQLTNIARDVIEDARAGRVYLPAEFLAAEGIGTVDAADPAQRAPLHRAALRLLEIAETYYASAYQGMAALPPRSAWAIAAARRVYREIGERLRRGGPAAWERRVSTSKTEKMALLAISLTDVAASRMGRADVPRTGLYRRPL